MKKKFFGFLKKKKLNNYSFDWHYKTKEKST